jgi:hypothetical protein
LLLLPSLHREKKICVLMNSFSYINCCFFFSALRQPTTSCKQPALISAVLGFRPFSLLFFVKNI